MGENSFDAEESPYKTFHADERIKKSWKSSEELPIIKRREALKEWMPIL
jgi:hypothetical protein